MADAGGNDTYTGFDGKFGIDVIYDSVEGFADEPSTDDRLDLTNYKLSDVAGFVALDTNEDEDDFVDWLVIVFDDNTAIGIYKYFDGTSASVAESGPGRGLIETISFADADVVFDQEVQSMAQSVSQFQRVNDTGEGEGSSHEKLADALNASLSEAKGSPEKE